MKNRKLFLAVYLVFLTLFLNAQDLSFKTRLPIVYIETGGREIPNSPRIKAKMEIAWKGRGVDNHTSDSHSHFVGDVNIETRGSTEQYPKKSFAFELKDAQDRDMDFPLVGMPEEEDWILYAPYTDKTLIRNVLTYTLASQISEVHAPRCEYVELFVNNNYEGLYVLMENIKRDTFRVDLARLRTVDIEGKQLTGGYIVKVDKPSQNSSKGWSSSYNNKNNSQTFYRYEYPNDEDIQPQQKTYIQNYINEFETLVYNKDFNLETGYISLINQKSFFDYIIMNELSKNVQGYKIDNFLYKEKNGKLFAGPIWNFNLAFGNADFDNAWEINGLQINSEYEDEGVGIPFWWEGILDDPYFEYNLRCRWDSLRENKLANERIFEVADSLTDIISEAGIRNFERWPVLSQKVWPNYFVGSSYQEEIDWLKQWITDRLTWLDYSMPGDCGNNKLDVETLEVSVYPNPFNSVLTFQVLSGTNQDIMIWLYNYSGQLILREDINPLIRGENELKIQTDNLAKGLYFYKVLIDYDSVAEGKILKY